MAKKKPPHITTEKIILFDEKGNPSLILDFTAKTMTFVSRPIWQTR